MNGSICRGRSQHDTCMIMCVAALTPGSAMRSGPPNSTSLKSTCGTPSRLSVAPPMQGTVSTIDRTMRLVALNCMCDTLMGTTRRTGPTRRYTLMSNWRRGRADRWWWWCGWVWGCGGVYVRARAHTQRGERVQWDVVVPLAVAERKHRVYDPSHCCGCHQ